MITQCRIIASPRAAGVSRVRLLVTDRQADLRWDRPTGTVSGPGRDRVGKYFRTWSATVGGSSCLEEGSKLLWGWLEFQWQRKRAADLGYLKGHALPFERGQIQNAIQSWFYFLFIYFINWTMFLSTLLTEQFFCKSKHHNQRSGTLLTNALKSR
jgi:hypothetical protein